MLFTIFTAIATYTRKRTVAPRTAYIIGGILLVIIIASAFHAKSIAQEQKAALDDMNSRTEKITVILKERQVTHLVGDYWRVLPVRAANQAITVSPRSSCLDASTALVSQDWQIDLTKTGFAYLLTLDRSLTNYPDCSLNDILTAYGRPNKSTVVAGTAEDPKEMLLFYDNGIHPNQPHTYPVPSTVTPIASQDLNDQTCSEPTLMQVVAHEDDELLFMNPDLQSSIDAGDCVRTIYVTAGDSGNDSFYWLGREKGAEDAYSVMLPSKPARWVERIVKLNSGQLVTIASPLGNKKISLVFMRLVDGNVKGGGFKRDAFQSLEKLQGNKITSLDSIDNHQHVTKDNLAASILDLFYLYRPTEIHTQSTQSKDVSRPDHSDHLAVGKLTHEVYSNNGLSVPLIFYSGYSIAHKPENVGGKELEAKEKAFVAYAASDPAACTPKQACWQKSNYRLFMPRQYRTDK